MNVEAAAETEVAAEAEAAKAEVAVLEAEGQISSVKSRRIVRAGVSSEQAYRQSRRIVRAEGNK
jgi:hypothetical protein